MSKDDADDQKEPRERAAQIADEVAELLHSRQEFHARQAQEFGYSEDIFKKVALEIRSTPDDPMYAVLANSMAKFRDFVKLKEAQAASAYFDVSSAAYAFGTSTSASASIIAKTSEGSQPWTGTFVRPSPPSGWSKSRSEGYAARLNALDPELGKLMRSAWQTFYGGSENAERAALALMRQLYDHLFGMLAADSKVRASPHFVTKATNRPEQIYRKERMTYVALELVEDKALGQLLESKSGYIDEVYARLNKIHKRGGLDREETLDVLTSMQTILEEWIDALDL